VKSSPVLGRLVPPESMTNRLKVPALAGPPVVAVISVGETTTTSDAGIAVGPTPLPCPISTVAPDTKLVPVILIGSDPVDFTSFSYSVLAGYSTLFAPPASAKVEAISGEATLVPPIVHHELYSCCSGAGFQPRGVTTMRWIDSL
jgi:hypothetical protein